VGLIRDFITDDHRSFEVTVPLDSRAYVYDVRRQALLGHTDHAAATLLPGETLLFAACPYPVDGLEIRAPDAVHPGEEIAFDLAVVSDRPGPIQGHAVRVTVSGPDGAERPYLTRNLYLAGGKGAYTLPVALNAAPGTWTFAAREALSGKDATQHFEVR
jgi:hypothetical protein